MKRKIGILVGVSITLVLATVTSFGQQADVIIKQRVSQDPAGMPPHPPGDFVFVASEMSFGGKVVKGAPYSAQAVTETIQTLGDGNRIINRISSSVYRDSEGRTRREQTLKGLGMLGNSGEALQTVFINDPVAGVTYALDSRNNVAHKSMPFKMQFSSKPGAPGGAVSAQRFEFKVKPGGPPEAGVVTGTAMNGAIHSVPPVIMTEGERFTVKTDGGAGGSYVFKRGGGPNPNEVKEQLGKQLVEGVEAEGTRTTLIIPAGEIGNDRAIEIVSERWYSAELDMVVKTRHSDPRSGETTYTLTNINRTEPAKTLFEVPAGYTVKEGPQAMPGVPMAMPRVKKLTNPE